MVNFTCDQCGRKYIYIVVAWIVMLGEVILHIRSLAVISVRGRLYGLIIWRSTSGPVLVLELLFQLLLQLLKNVVLVIFQSLNCERLVNRLEVL